MKTVLMVFLAAAFLPAQQQFTWKASTGAVSLSSATTAATVQQPATGGDQNTIDSIVVVCPASCTITETQGGTAATTTACPSCINGIIPYQNANFGFNFYTASNQSGGTVIGTAVCSAACTQTFIGAVWGQPIMTMSSSGTSVSMTVSITAVTGVAYITFYGRRLS
jgi:hypothetical protein